MRQWALYVIGCIAVALVPVLAAAQGPAGFGPPPGLAGGVGPVLTGPGGPPMAGPPMCPPPPCGPAPCEQGPTGIGFGGYVGYLTGPYGAQFRFDPVLAPLGGGIFGSISHGYALSGIFVGGSGRTLLGENIQGTMKASWFFPSNARSREEYGLGTGTVSKRTWHTDSQWGTIDASGAYIIGCNAAAIVGLRFDHFMTNFKESYDYILPPGIVWATDRADVTVASYLPYVGFAVQHTSCHGTLSAGLLGFPRVWGDVAYKETYATLGRFEASRGFQGGHFAEAFAEAETTKGPVSFGAFARWQALHVESQMTMDLAVPPAALAPLPIVGDSQTFRFRLDRQAWTFGGKVSISF
jgi:hypothetical protein